MAPLLSAKQQIAIKQEATAGTFETLAAADVIMHTGIAEFEPDVQMTPREAMTASMSPRGSVPGTRAARIRFKMYLRGSYNHTTGAIAAPTASTLADFHVPFAGCGALGTVSGAGPNEITTYVPTTSLVSDDTSGGYCTVGLYEDGKRYAIHGAQGNCKLTFEVGAPVLAEFDFLGVYNAPTDTALLSGAVYPTAIEPTFLGASISSIGSFTTGKIRSMTLDFGNEVVMRPYPNNTTGLFTAQIVRRRPVGTLDPEEVLAATEDFWVQWLAGTVGAITTGTFPSGGTNYNQFLLNVPNADYTKVGLADRDGIMTAPLEYEATANSVAGDDEWSLTQT